MCLHVWYLWHIHDIYGGICRYIDIIILKGILSSCQAFLGAQCAVLKAFMLPWRMSKWQLGWRGRVLGKLHWKGEGSFHGFEHVQIPLPTLWLLPHLCVCFQKREGQERAELVPKGGVSGRCEGFKIIKTCSNQQCPQLSSSCLSILPTKACFGSVLSFRNQTDPLLCFQPFDLLTT